MVKCHARSERERISEVMSRVHLPLTNIEFVIEQYLMTQGARLDLETRMLLACVRDGVGQVADSTRRLTESEDTSDQEIVARSRAA